MPPKQTPQIKKSEKPEEGKAKKAVIAALLLALILWAPLVAAQQSGVDKGKEIVWKSGVVEGVQTGFGALTAAWGVAWWASLVIFIVYYVLMSKLAPATWARWGYINDLIDKLKWLLVAVIISPFAMAAVLFGVDAVAQAYGQSSGIDPAAKAGEFLSNVLIKGIADTISNIKLW
ncbi:MAG: hypothetical protein QW680_10105 [Pyrobaculum sp.]